jgi:hypothetical protein
MTAATFELPNEHRLNALDALKRAADLLNYVLNRRTTDDDPGETWVIETISHGIEKARAELNDAARSAPVLNCAGEIGAP